MPLLQDSSRIIGAYILLCSEVWKVWANLLQWWRFNWVTPASVEGVLQWWLGTKFKKAVLKVWNLYSCNAVVSLENKK